MSGYLSLSDGSNLPVQDGFVIGRVAGCDLVIDDTKASRRHARILVENGVVEIEDLGSSNGTLLNGKPVTRRLLRGGDRVQIGKTEFEYREGVMPGTASSASAASSPFADDDVDLFGDSPEPASKPAAKPVAPPPQATAVAAPARPLPPTVPSPTVPSPTVPSPTVASPPAASPPPPKSVVEFADEVVEVRRAPAAPQSTARTSAPAAPVANNASRILQFHKVGAGGGGLLGDDLSQMSGGMRALLVVGVVVLGAAIVFGIMHLMR